MRARVVVVQLSPWPACTSNKCKPTFFLGWYIYVTIKSYACMNSQFIFYCIATHNCTISMWNLKDKPINWSCARVTLRCITLIAVQAKPAFFLIWLHTYVTINSYVCIKTKQNTQACAMYICVQQHFLDQGSRRWARLVSFECRATAAHL
jgi:hypothetical protein